MSRWWSAGSSTRTSRRIWPLMMAGLTIVPFIRAGASSAPKPTPHSASAPSPTVPMRLHLGLNREQRARFDRTAQSEWACDQSFDVFIEMQQPNRRARALRYIEPKLRRCLTRNAGEPGALRGQLTLHFTTPTEGPLFEVAASFVPASGAEPPPDAMSTCLERLVTVPTVAMANAPFESEYTVDWTVTE